MVVLERVESVFKRPKPEAKPAAEKQPETGEQFEVLRLQKGGLSCRNTRHFMIQLR